MGFWKTLLGIEDEENSENNLTNDSKAITQETNNTLFVTKDEEEDFQSSIYGALQIYSTDIFYIKEVLPERGENLEQQINALTKLLELKNDENDPDIQKSFSELKKAYEEDKRMADGEYTIRELEKQNRNMDKIFEESIKKSGLSKSKLDEFISYISKIQNKITESDNSERPLLTGVQRQKFNTASMRSEYRIKMLELMYLLDVGDINNNPFKDLSVVKQRMFSKMLFEDAQEAQIQYNNLSAHEEIFNKYYGRKYFSEIDNMAQFLSDKFADITMIEDFSMSQLFDSSNSEAQSFEILKKFIRFKTSLNDMRSKKSEFIERSNKEKEAEERKKKEEELERQKELEAQNEEKRKKAERKEKLKNMSNNEIDSRITEMEQDLTSTGNRFINILDFQKEVAREKGLLDNESEVQNNELFYYIVGPVTLSKIIEKANENGISYLIFPDSQEHNEEKLFTFVVSKSDQEITQDLPEFNSKFYSLRNQYNWKTYKKLGKYNDIITKKLEDEICDINQMKDYLSCSQSQGVTDIEVGYIDYSYRGDDILDYNTQLILKALRKVYDELDNFGKSEEYLERILCYVQVPAIRNIIPILQKFQKAEIPVYFEPVTASKRNQTNRENINIYFKRKDLGRFYSDVYREISNRDVGIATLKCMEDDYSLGKVMKARTKWPEDIKTHDSKGSNEDNIGR